MKRILLQLVLLVLLASLCLSAFLSVEKILELPFRSTNDALHSEDSAFNLDFLIPGGTYVDEKMTIGEVIKVRFRREKAFYERWVQSLFNLVPPAYRYAVNLAFFFFWFLCFMTFFRVFTFMGYGGAFRISLLLAGVCYYFMPDFWPARWDDVLAVLIPLLVIFTWRYVFRRKKRQLNVQA